MMPGPLSSASMATRPENRGRHAAECWLLPVRIPLPWRFDGLISTVTVGFQSTCHQGLGSTVAQPDTRRAWSGFISNTGWVGLSSFLRPLGLGMLVKPAVARSRMIRQCCGSLTVLRLHSRLISSAFLFSNSEVVLNVLVAIRKAIEVNSVRGGFTQVRYGSPVPLLQPPGFQIFCNEISFTILPLSRMPMYATWC